VILWNVMSEVYDWLLDYMQFIRNLIICSLITSLYVGFHS